MRDPEGNELAKTSPAGAGTAAGTLKARHPLEGGGVCEHQRMMFGHLLNSPYDILIVPIAMILLFAVILIRMYGPRKPVTSKDADHRG